MGAHPCSPVQIFLREQPHGSPSCLLTLPSPLSQHPLHHYFALQTSVESAHSSLPPLCFSPEFQATLASPLDHCLTLVCHCPLSPSVSVPSGCGNQMPEAECFVNNRKFISHSSGGWEVRNQELADSAPGESVCFLALEDHILRPRMVLTEGMRELSGSLL